MAKGKPRDVRKEQQWRRCIAQWQKSGLTARAFCARHRLSLPSFYAWRRILQQRDAAATTFLPVHVIPNTQPLTSACLELVLASGRRLAIHPGFDAHTLKLLLTVLEELTSC
jgi:hypothetical protein